ncbi:unnamed protein product, partial [Mesorhabditis belari]|uniref:glutathione transferase n=1 Tax=Mesorhabditis belari TaxID=2138241 RepID=A0AAF3FHE6_9BILA
MTDQPNSSKNADSEKFNPKEFLMHPINYIRSFCAAKDESTMPHYKLTYFDLRGRAEVSRQLFALAGVPYEDNRLNFEQWPAFKQTTPFGQIPLLEVDGTMIAQSITIARFLARRFGYIGANDIEAAQIDSLADVIMDYHNEQKHFFPVLMGRMPGDKDALYKEIYEPVRDKYLPILVEKFLKKNPNGYLIGSKVSYADLMLAEHISVYMNVLPNAFDKYPELIAHKEKVQSLPALKQWIETRPKTSY